MEGASFRISSLVVFLLVLCLVNTEQIENPFQNFQDQITANFEHIFETLRAMKQKVDLIEVEVNTIKIQTSNTWDEIIPIKEKLTTLEGSVKEHSLSRSLEKIDSINSKIIELEDSCSNFANSSCEGLTVLVDSIADIKAQNNETFNKMSSIQDQLKNLSLNGSLDSTKIDSIHSEIVEMYNSTKNCFERTNKDVKELHDVDFEICGGIANTKGGHWSNSWLPMNAFRGSTWIGGLPATVPKSLWFEFPKPIRVVKYSFSTRNDNIYKGTKDGPTKYSFWASNSRDCSNETSWDILHMDDSGREFTSTCITKTEDVQNSQSYHCYGFKVTDVPGRSGVKYVSIRDVHFYTSP